MTEAVSVNKELSIKLGLVVRKLKFRDEFLKRPFIDSPLSDELKASMFFYAVGICHQTYHLAHPTKNLYGWDYLEDGFLKIAQEQSELLDCHYLSKLDPESLAPLISPYFSPDGLIENCSLDRLEERCQLWIDMALFLEKKETTFLEFMKSSNGIPDYFYRQLSEAEAYSDPLLKKTSFLMKLLEDGKLIRFKDQDQIIPIMDYHMQRVLLRTGAIEVNDPKLKSSLQKKENIQSDIKLREACIESMKIIAQCSEYSILKMNDVFYTMGRSCCHENPVCVHPHTCDKSPCSLSLAVEIPQTHSCIFEEICFGAKSDDYKSLWQPQIETHFY